MKESVTKTNLIGYKIFTEQVQDQQIMNSQIPSMPLA
jgi:hypothetical protein